MGEDTVRRNLTIRKDQDEWLNKKNDDYTDLDKSLLTRRALDFYINEGFKRDKTVKELMGEGNK